VGVRVGVGVRVFVGVKVGVFVGVDVRVPVGVMVGVRVGVSEIALVGRLVAVNLGVTRMIIKDLDAVAVGVDVGDKPVTGNRPTGAGRGTKIIPIRPKIIRDNALARLTTKSLGYFFIIL
jgi:hypothetical protein